MRTPAATFETHLYCAEAFLLARLARQQAGVAVTDSFERGSVQAFVPSASRRRPVQESAQPLPPPRDADHLSRSTGRVHRGDQGWDAAFHETHRDGNYQPKAQKVGALTCSSCCLL